MCAQYSKNRVGAKEYSPPAEYRGNKASREKLLQNHGDTFIVMVAKDSEVCMTQASYKHVSIEDIPDCKGKQVYLKIINSPKVDREKLHREALEYEKRLGEQMREEGLIE